MPSVQHGHRCCYRSETCGLSTPHFQPSNYCVSELLSLVNSGIRGPTLQQRPDVALRPVRSKVPVHQWQSAVSLAWHGRPHSDPSPLPIHSRVTGEGFVYLSVSDTSPLPIHAHVTGQRFVYLSVRPHSDASPLPILARVTGEGFVYLSACASACLSVCLSICA